MYQNQADTEAVQQGEVVNQAGEMVGFDRFTAEQNHERLTTMGVDVRAGLPEPLNEVIHRLRTLGIPNGRRL